MKKKKHTDPIPDEDKLDGTKAVGCLFIGIVLIAIFISIASFLIDQIR